MNVLKDLQEWYRSNCDGEWEHDWGVSVGTLSNPGWSLKIDLSQTHLAGKQFEDLSIENSDDDWMFCRVVENAFDATGDPSKLQEMLATSLNWAKTQDGWLQPPVYETTDDENLKFWDTLTEEVAGELCQIGDCESNRIKWSVLCREHHFERYKSEDKEGP